MSKVSNLMRMVILQLKGSPDKVANVKKAVAQIEKAVSEHKPRLITLPEIFNIQHSFHEYAEPIPNGYSSQILSKLAKSHGVYILGGTIPEQGENDKFYNTCTVWNPEGELIAKYRKLHLFDVDIEGGINFRESKYFSKGNNFTTFEIDGHKCGIGICYDMRFEEMARVYRNEGCEMIIYPAAFNMTTGPMHWELLQRGRAVDNQLFVVTSSPARDESASYVAYGHSMVVDPWANVIKSAKEGEETIVVDIDFSLVQQVREQIPVFKQRRPELYGTENKTK